MINFAKMHGNGNDFVMVNSLEKEFNPKKSLIKKLGDRNLGIGFDQMIHIGAPSKDNRDFTVKFYNADGGRANMCLNGVRCAATYVWDNKFAPKRTLIFQTKKIDIECRPLKEGVEVSLKNPKYFISQGLERKLSKIIKTSFKLIDSGNLHLCIQKKSIDQFDLNGLYKKLETLLRPLGINLSIYSKDKGSYNIRTYENGAGETLSCGSASFSVAYLCLIDEIKKTTIKSSGGSIKFIKLDDRILMSGPTKFVYSGSFHE